ncbi:MAG: hypothetical protein ACLPWF_16975, partial [Bryobacteraceae bacterium]
RHSTRTISVLSGSHDSHKTSIYRHAFQQNDVYGLRDLFSHHDCVRNVCTSSNTAERETEHPVQRNGTPW